MGLGGGTFVTQNKVLPGAYINFVSKARANATLSERGVVTMPFSLDWGELGVVFEVSSADLEKDSKKLFGYDFSAPQLRALREMFRHTRIGYLYRLGSGGEKAANAYGNAKYPGTRGNDITVVVRENVDDSAKKDVLIMLDGELVATQTVGGASEMKDDDYVAYSKSGSLDLTAGTPMTGGTNPTVSNGDYQTYLDAVEGYSFNYALQVPHLYRWWVE